jgi:Undecaprenyl-phosphate glucose phosphotransferase
VSEVVHGDDVDIRGHAADRYFVKLPYGWIAPLVFLIELAAVVSASVISGVGYVDIVQGEAGEIETYVAIGAAAFLYYGIVFVYRGNYSLFKLTSGAKQLQEVTVVWALVCLFLMGLAFLLKVGPHFSRGATFTFFVLGWLFLLCCRYCVSRFLAAADTADAVVGRNVILIGDSRLLKNSAWVQQLEQQGCYTIVKVFHIDESGQDLPLDEVVRAARRDAQVEGIFLALDWTQSNRIDDFTRQLSVLPLSVRLLPDSNVSRFLSMSAVQVGPLWAAELQRRPLSMPERATKRALDLLLASATGVLLLPLLLAVAALVKLDSVGPVFFTQTRGGFNGLPFRIFKFRTLTPREEGNAVEQVRRDDRRLTRLGRILRRTSIDELPQLLNVIRGEMSLVGPRPHAAAHDSQYVELIANYAFRHHVKPGLTGWAQVNGFRGETDIEAMKQRIDFDLWYVNNWSLWLDVKIIVRTLIVLFHQPMAY